MSIKQKIEKAQGRLEHSLQRVEERYKFALTEDDLREITLALAKVQHSKNLQVLKVQKQTCNRYFHKIRFKGHQYKLIWAPKQNAICTFLPPDASGHGIKHDQRQRANQKKAEEAAPEPVKPPVEPLPLLELPPEAESLDSRRERHERAMEKRIAEKEAKRTRELQEAIERHEAVLARLREEGEEW